MIYNVIGLMSGSSGDGLDIAFTSFTETAGKWTFEIVKAACVPYPDGWEQRLHAAAELSVPDFLRLHTEYGRLTADLVLDFIQKNELEHKVHFIASHGHTAFHDPAQNTTFQLADGATIAAKTGLTVISDLRNKDVALGGQGAPIVPIADRLLFSDYQILVNIGGIANLTLNVDEAKAYDICPANQVLNFFAKRAGKAFDDGGSMARTGEVDEEILSQLDALDFYKITGPKSLANSYSQHLIALLEPLSTADALATATHHIATQIAKSIQNSGMSEAQVLITGGGALNIYLQEKINEMLPQAFQIAAADEQTILYKEAVAMALFGTLRWREEENVLASATGASKNSVGGAIWVN